MSRKKIKIGDLLVEKNIITPEQVQQALEEQKNLGCKFGEALVKLNLLQENEFLNFIAEQLNIPLIKLSEWDFDPEVTRLLPEKLARRHRAVVIDEDAGTIRVAMADPTNFFACDEIEQAIQRPVSYALADEHDLLSSLDRVYRRIEDVGSFAQDLSSELNVMTTGDSEIELVSGDEASTVNKLLQSVFEDAVQINATDIHIEPDEKLLRIRLRVDGLLQEHTTPNTQIAPAIAQRVKLMSKLDISEKRLPQDGAFTIVVKGIRINVRVSTMPLEFGENVVMRLLNPEAVELNLDKLGIMPHILKDFRGLLKRPHGIILVTGPTGSGKTTTLYSGLSEMNLPEKKILTAEDPVEYRLPRINQVEVIPKIGLDFSRVLRAALRQDPDIILIGEIRDSETAEIATRAALTGHLVLASLHTNDAASSATRLIDMGVESYLVASTLLAVLSQRLVRRICTSCKVEQTLNEEQQVWLDELTKNQPRDATFYTGKGCAHCNQTGYRGRVGVYELLSLNNDMRNALREQDLKAYNLATAEHEEKASLAVSGLEMVYSGITSIDELIRVAGEM